MLKIILSGLIRFYQFYLRRALPVSCRFAPSCSEYALEAISKYGCLKGMFKALGRILRCQPFSKRSGYDPLI